PLDLPDLMLEVTLDWAIEQQPPKLSISKLQSNGRDLRERYDDRERLLEGLPRAYALVNADHTPRAETDGRQGRLAQIRATLDKAMLAGARIIAIEEPEAHLHAPTSGHMLRQLLVRLVEEKHIDQLFIVTHSNLFDLDSTGFFDVHLKNGETKVTKKPLD